MSSSVQGCSSLAQSAYNSYNYRPPAEVVGVASVVTGMVAGSPALRKFGAVLTLGSLAWRAVSFVAFGKSSQPNAVVSPPADHRQEVAMNQPAAVDEQLNPQKLQSKKFRELIDEMSKRCIEAKGKEERSLCFQLASGLAQLAFIEDEKEKAAAEGKPYQPVDPIDPTHGAASSLKYEYSPNNLLSDLSCQNGPMNSQTFSIYPALPPKAACSATEANYTEIT